LSAGPWNQPNLPLSYLLGARQLIETGERDGGLRDTAFPVGYLQRHAFELELKSLIESALSIYSDRSWLETPGAWPSVAARPPLEHGLPKLVKCLKRCLKVIAWTSPVPPAVEEMAKELTRLEKRDPTGFRYLSSTDGSQMWPEKVTLDLSFVQERLETIFEDHFFVDSKDFETTTFNFAGHLAVEAHQLRQLAFQHWYYHYDRTPELKPEEAARTEHPDLNDLNEV
jgi:hypothetical protein